MLNYTTSPSASYRVLQACAMCGTMVIYDPSVEQAYHTFTYRHICPQCLSGDGQGRPSWLSRAGEPVVIGAGNTVQHGQDE